MPAVADLVHRRVATRPPRTPQARRAVTMPRGAPVDSASARVVQAREDSVACFDSRRRRGPDRPESAGVLDHASYSDRPGLRRRVRLWASNDPNSHRERAKARPTQHAARLEKLERCDPDHHESYISWTDFERNQ